MIKKEKKSTSSAKIYYHDIGDYLTQNEKLKILSTEESIKKTAWLEITPNKYGDWVGDRRDDFEGFQQIGDKATKGKDNTTGMFILYSNGVVSGRDAWVYNFSENKLIKSVDKLIANYSYELNKYNKSTDATNDETKIGWTRGLRQKFNKKIAINLNKQCVQNSVYRPFCKQYIYFNKDIDENQAQTTNIFPTSNTSNLTISINAISTKGITPLMMDYLPDLHSVGDTQTFPLYTWESIKDYTNNTDTLFETEIIIDGYRCKDNITDATLKSYQETYGDKVITKEDIFYYIYAILHQPKYREDYAYDLSKMLPRIPKVKTNEAFWKFSKTGRELGDLHVSYEEVEPYKLEEKVLQPLTSNDLEEQYKYYAITPKMKWASKDDHSAIIYNDNITIAGIPPEAEEYIVNGKSGLAWLIDRYQDKVDTKSQIRNNCNDWLREVKDPRYIIDLIGRVTTVSVKTVELVKGLPELEILEEGDIGE